MLSFTNSLTNSVVFIYCLMIFVRSIGLRLLYPLISLRQVSASNSFMSNLIRPDLNPSLKANAQSELNLAPALIAQITFGADLSLQRLAISGLLQQDNGG